MSESIKKFYESDFYIIFICILTFFSWILNLNVHGFVFITTLGFTSLFFCNDFKAVIVTLLISVMSFVDITSNVINVYNLLICVILILYIIIVLYFFIHKNFTSKVKINFGNLKFGVLIALIVALLGGISYPYFNNLLLFRLFFKSIGVYLFYLVCLNGLKSDYRRYFCRMLIYACVLVVFEVLIKYSKGNFIYNVLYKQSHLGWGVSNIIAVLFTMLIPLSAYLSINSKYDYIYIGIIFLAAIFVCFLISRGNMLVVLFSLPICLIFAYKKTINKKRYLFSMILCSSICFLICLIVFLNYSDVITSYIEDKLDSGRFDIYKEAIDRFKQFPIFGIGLYRDKLIPTLANYGSVWQWHSTPLYILTSFGIVGVLGFIPFYYQRYKLLLKNISVFKLSCLIAVLSFEIYGLIDTMFINMYLNLFIFLWLALCENEKPQKQLSENFLSKKTK